MSVPVFAFDDNMMARIEAFSPEPLLQAFRDVMTCGNHDMLHHYTNETLNANIAQRRAQAERLSEQEKFGINEWADRAFNLFDDDESPQIYESWLMLNHKRVRQRMEETPEGVNLWESCTRFFDELERIEKDVGADTDTLNAHEMADYFGTMLCFALMRFLPLNHPVMDYVIDRLEKADPATSLVLDMRSFILSEAQSHSTVSMAMSNYSVQGIKIVPNDLKSFDYRATKKMQVALLAPWIARLLSQALPDSKLSQMAQYAPWVQLDTELSQVQNRVGRVNLDMFSAVDFGGRKFIPDSVQEIKWADGGFLRVQYKEGKLHCDDGPAFVEISATGARTERWHKNGKLYNGDSPAWILTKPDGYLEKKWFDENENLHREGGPAHVTSEPSGAKEESWYHHGLLHRLDGPADIETRPDGYSREQWMRHGEFHREDGPARIAKWPGGGYREEWFVNGKLHREDGPAHIEVLKDGTRIEKCFVNGELHRENGPAEVTVYPDGMRDEQWWKNDYSAPAPGQEDGPDEFFGYNSWKDAYGFGNGKPFFVSGFSDAGAKAVEAKANARFQKVFDDFVKERFKKPPDFSKP